MIRFLVSYLLGLRGMGRSFRDLVVWQEARLLAKDCYELTSDLPKAEMFGLTAQIRACVVSVSANIAEGSGRGSKKEFAQFLRIARGSLYELESYLVIVVDLGFVSCEQVSQTEERLK